MKKFRGGDESAFDQIEARYRKIVWSLCRRILLDPSEAEDATQRAFVKLWLSRETYSAEKPFWPWLRVIALKTCLDQLRALERLRLTPFEIMSESTDRSGVRVSAPLLAVSPDRLAQLSEMQAAFESCWALLAPNQRALLHCIDWSDWRNSWENNAALMGMKQSAFRTATIRYGRALLGCLRARGFSPSPSELLTVLEQNTLDQKE